MFFFFTVTLKLPSLHATTLAATPFRSLIPSHCSSSPLCVAPRRRRSRSAPRFEPRSPLHIFLVNVYSGLSFELFDSVDGYTFCAENFVVFMLCILADAFFRQCSVTRSVITLVNVNIYWHFDLCFFLHGWLWLWKIHFLPWNFLLFVNHIQELIVPMLWIFCIMLIINLFFFLNFLLALECPFSALKCWCIMLCISQYCTRQTCVVNDWGIMKLVYSLWLVMICWEKILQLSFIRKCYLSILDFDGISIVYPL